MFCPNCGKPLADEAAFCGYCGTHLKGMSSPPAPVPTPTPAAPAPTPAPAAPVPTPKKKRRGKTILLLLLALLLLAGGGVLGWFVGRNGWDVRQWGKSEEESYSIESVSREDEEDKEADPSSSPASTESTPPAGSSLPSQPPTGSLTEALTGRWTNHALTLTIQADRSMTYEENDSDFFITGVLAADGKTASMTMESGEQVPATLSLLEDGRLVLISEENKEGSVFSKEGDIPDGTSFIQPLEELIGQWQTINGHVLTIQADRTVEMDWTDSTAALAEDGKTLVWTGGQGLPETMEILLLEDGRLFFWPVNQEGIVFFKSSGV